MKFKSKIDWWAYPVFASMPLMNIWLIVRFILYGGIVLAVCGVIFLICNIFLVAPIWLNTCYTLEDTKLNIRSGLCINMRIPYSDIKSVKETRDPTASAGLSLDRIEIVFGVGGSILISPQNKQEFLQQLEQRRK